MRKLSFIILLISLCQLLFGQGQIGLDQTIKYRSTPEQLYFVIPPSGAEPYSYQWQRSNYSAGPWSNILRATLAVYSPPALGKDAYFRCGVSGAAGFIGYTNVVAITISANLKAGTIGYSQTICSNTSPNPLIQLTAASGGGGSYTYQWQNSLDGLSWSDIGYEATNTGYAPPVLTSATWYRRLVTDGANSKAASNAVKITVNPGINLAQIQYNLHTFNNTSTNLKVMISGGISPYTINYTRDGVAQDPIQNYISGTDIPTGVLSDGIYTYSLTSVTGANGCGALSLGSPVTVTVTDNPHFDFTYTDRNNLLADGWDYTAITPSGGARNTEQTSGAVVSYNQQTHPGVLRIPVDVGDLAYGINNTRNTLFHDLPEGWTSIRLKVAAFNPNENYQQAGLTLYQDDDNYLQIVRAFSGDNIVEFAHESQGSLTSLPSIDILTTSNLHFRLDRDIETGTITAYYSLDNSGWIMLGDVIRTLVNPRLGILANGDATIGGLPNADFAWAEISTLPLEPITDQLTVYPRQLIFNTVEGEGLIGTKPLFISTDLDRTIRWSQSENLSWLVPDLTNGLTEGILRIDVNRTGLTSGVHTGTLTLQSDQITGDPVVVQVTVIVNPNTDGIVKVATWKDGKGGAMSVSVDDGAISGFTELQSYGYKGTFVCNDVTPSQYYIDNDLFGAGMDLGSHLVNHHSSVVPTSDFLRYQDIIPSIEGFCRVIPGSCPYIVSLVWPSGLTNYRMQSIASDYFLSARGYNIDQLEDPSPENLMNLKSFNSLSDTYPPDIFINHVNEAIAQNKWFNLVLHYTDDNGGAIAYASSQNIWIESIATVIKYILQRDRFILTNFSSAIDNINFEVSRLAIPVTSYRSFETAFGQGDITTLQIDIDDDRIIEGVYVDNIQNTSFQTREVSGNLFLFLNIRLEPAVNKTVEVRYVSETTPRIYLNPVTLDFVSYIGTNPAPQSLNISSNLPFNWTVTVDHSAPDWLNVNPESGSNNGTISVSADITGLAAGIYNKVITVSSVGASNTPQLVNVSLVVNAPALAVSPLSLSFSAFVDGIPPSDQTISIENSGIPGEMTWSVEDDASWLSASPLSGNGSGLLTVSASHAGLEAGIYNGTITISSPQASNSPIHVPITLTVETGHYDFIYSDRNSLILNGWDFIARTAAGGSRDTEANPPVSYDQVSHPGVLRIPVDLGDLSYNFNNTRNTLFRDLPSNWTSIRLKIASFNPTQVYQLAGLIAYQDDNNYVLIANTFDGENRIVMQYETPTDLFNLNSVGNSTSTNLHFRFDRVEATNTITSYYSFNNIDWVPNGSIVLTLNNPRLGILVCGDETPGDYPNADIAWAEIYTSSGAKSDGTATSLNDIKPESEEVLFEQQNKLYQNYPNPFNTNTWIEFDLAEDTKVTLEMYNSMGHNIGTVLNEFMKSGNYKFILDSNNYPAGIYYLTMKTGIFRSTIKMSLVK